MQLRAEEQRAQQERTLYRQVPESILGALQALRPLIVHDGKQAVRFAEQLASVHRYILSEAHRELVILREELEVLALHARVMEQRFGVSLALQLTAPCGGDAASNCAGFATPAAGECTTVWSYQN